MFKELDDEELGSLLLLKIPRHCRNKSSGGEEQLSQYVTNKTLGNAPNLFHLTSTAYNEAN